MKYQLNKQLACYGRLERFLGSKSDLTNPLNIGKYIDGTTLGFEFTPYRTVSFNAEWRIQESDQLIFKKGNKMVNQRNEFNLCLDLWF